MPSGSTQKLIRKLRLKKHRWAQELFVAEGPKVVKDLIDQGLEPLHLLASTDFPQAELISEKDLAQISSLQTANQVIGVFPFPKLPPQDGPVLILDGINDPGNLGTLIRTADWFGMGAVYCLPGTADLYNPKTVMSTMGSLARVPVFYREAEELHQHLKTDYSFWVADMMGQDPAQWIDLPAKRALILGSESHGPSKFWQGKAQQVCIPKRGASKIDSLNVGIAGGILMDRFTR